MISAFDVVLGIAFLVALYLQRRFNRQVAQNLAGQIEINRNLTEAVRALLEIMRQRDLGIHAPLPTLETKAAGVASIPLRPRL